MIKPMIKRNKKLKEKEKTRASARPALNSEMAALKRRLVDGERGSAGGAIFDRSEEGRNWRRFLPRGKKVEGEWSLPHYKEVVVHRKLGPDGKDVLCIGDACPACKEYKRENAKINEKYGRGTELSKKKWMALKDRLGQMKRWFWLVLQYTGQKLKSTEVKVLEVGTQLQTPLMEEMYDDRNCGDFCDPQTGRPMAIVRKGVDRNTKYYLKRGDAPLPLKCWPDIRDVVRSFDLDAAIALRYPKLTPTEMKRVMDGDDAAGEDDEESEDEDRAAKRLAAKARKRREAREGKSNKATAKPEKTSRLKKKLSAKTKRRALLPNADKEY